MAVLGDWFSRIFSSDVTRGLSGDAERVALGVDDGGFYASRLQLHRASGDFRKRPELLWSCGSRRSPRGLKAHLRASVSEVADFTDLLVVLSEDDWVELHDPFEEPWEPQAERLLAERVASLFEKQGWLRPYPQRPFRFRFLRDGRDGLELGLQAGEFVTGLLPNLYTGPVRGSRALIAVQLHVPGQWDDYREVGRFYDDQLLFTLGSHVLDNARHPSLLAPALYRLQRRPDGSLLHVLHPSFQDRLRIGTADAEAGVLTIEDLEGRPLLYFVLALLDEEPQGERPPASFDSEELASGWFEGGGGLEEGTPVGEERAPGEAASGERAAPARGEGMEPVPYRAQAVLVGESTSSLRHATIVPDALDARLLTLEERGALLQKVHFSDFMEGYDVYVGPTGLGTAMEDPLATFQVRGKRVSFVLHRGPGWIGGRRLREGEEVPLEGDVELRVGEQHLEYRDLRAVEADGWPYLGEIRRASSRTYLPFGERHRIGRSPSCSVRLPDAPHNENIHWRRELRDTDTIRSRHGDIPKSQFYNDSIMVASEHAELDLRGEPVLRAISRHCYTFVRRGGRVYALAPVGRPGLHELSLLPGDELLVGNNLFELSFNPDAARQAAPPSAGELAELAGAVDDELEEVEGLELDEVEELEELDELEPEESPAPRSAPIGEVDVPTPAVPLELGSLPPRSTPGEPEPPPAAGQESPGEGSGGAAAPGGAGSAAGRSLREAQTPALPREGAVVGSPPRPAVEAPPGPGAAADLPRGPSSLEGQVVVLDEGEWQFELSRRASLVQLGWMVSGELRIGNHRGAELVVPENRIAPKQRFRPADYFRLQLRRRRLRVRLLDPLNARLLLDGKPVPEAQGGEGLLLQVVRRDEEGEEDFTVDLAFRELEARLPDPRARFLGLDLSDRMVAGLYTRGLPLRQPRELEIEGLRFVATHDGERLTISDYLPSYQLGQGYRPFLLGRAGDPFRTAPEDGSPFELEPGSLLIVGRAIFSYEKH